MGAAAIVKKFLPYWVLPAVSINDSVETRWSRRVEYTGTWLAPTISALPIYLKIYRLPWAIPERETWFVTRIRSTRRGIWFNPIPGWWGPLGPSFGFFLFHCQTPQDWKLILGDFSLTFIVHILTKKVAGSGQVRSPEAVSWPHIIKVCNHASARVFDWSFFFSSRFSKNTSMCNLYISELFYLWPEVRPDSWPLHYKPMGKYWNASCCV